VSDSKTDRIQVLDYATGRHLRTIGSSGVGRGQFKCPLSFVLLDSALIVAESDRVQVLNYPDGTCIDVYKEKKKGFDTYALAVHESTLFVARGKTE
jgi:hypothetical protein